MYRIAKQAVAAVFAAVVLSMLMAIPAFASDRPTLAVTHTEVQCGQPVTFDLSASGGTGNYLYQFQCVRYSEDGVVAYVTDPSRAARYSEQTQYQFTFYASGEYDAYFYVINADDISAGYGRTVVHISINDPAWPTIEQRADAIVAECLAAGCTTDYDKALWLHDWIIHHVTYDNTYVHCGAEGVLTERGLGICESYHRAYVMLLKRAGIETGRMEGNFHVWTAAKLDGQWCQIDATWDDSDQPDYTGLGIDLEHLYFGLPDSVMTAAHSDHAPHAGYESITFDNNYFIHSGAISQWSDQYAAAIQQQVAGGAEQFTVPVVGSVYGKIFYPLVAHDLSQRDWGEGVQLSVEYGERSFSDGWFACTVTRDEPAPVLTDWQKIDGVWYYYDETGALVVGWLKWNNKWYYLDPADGHMVTGWLKWNGKWYYLQSGGAMATGWLKVGGKWYYFGGNGAAYCNQWVKSSGKWYWLDGSCAMVANCSLVIGGKRYRFAADGHML